MILLVAFALAIGWLAGQRAASQPGTRASPQDGLAAFERIATVLQSPRCLNCHPRSDRPMQGDERRVHQVNVQRGAESKGVPGMSAAPATRSTTTISPACPARRNGISRPDRWDGPD
jgi:hypothetical protein